MIPSYAVATLALSLHCFRVLPDLSESLPQLREGGKEHRQSEPYQQDKYGNFAAEAKQILQAHPKAYTHVTPTGLSAQHNVTRLLPDHAMQKKQTVFMTAQASNAHTHTNTHARRTVPATSSCRSRNISPRPLSASPSTIRTQASQQSEARAAQRDVARDYRWKLASSPKARAARTTSRRGASCGARSTARARLRRGVGEAVPAWRRRRRRVEVCTAAITRRRSHGSIHVQEPID